MSGIVMGFLAFVGVLGAVVLFHEFGHYLAAKAFGITVEVFSVGFGPRIWGFTRRGTEYRVSWVPLGGYVKLRGESAPEDGKSPEPGDMMAHSRLQRFIVFVMGAVFNLVTAFGLTTIILMKGMPEFSYLYEVPVVGEVDPDSPAHTAGLLPGDRIVSFGGRPVATWKDLQIEMLLSPRQTKDVVLERAGARIETKLSIQATEGDVGQPGIAPATSVLIGGVSPGWPGETAGLRKGDRILSIDDVPMRTVHAVQQVIRAAPGRAVRFGVERGGATLDLTVTPREEDGKGLVGVELTEPFVTRAYPLLEAARRSVRQNVESVGLVFVTFRKLITRELSMKAFSGPIDLYRFSSQEAEQGLVPYLQLIAFVSLQLGIINLFPIPPLDGGHLMTLTIEGALRRDLSTAIKERIMQAGLILLLLFMGTVIYFDITKNLHHFFN